MKKAMFEELKRSMKEGVEILRGRKKPSRVFNVTKKGKRSQIQWSGRLQNSVGGFTLIELLVVIAIIAILASILLPALAAAKTRARVGQARLEMSQLVAGINSYHSTYGRYPASGRTLALAVAANRDFTYGDALAVVNLLPVLFNTNNAEVVTILMDLPNWPNTNHVKNTQQIKFLNTRVIASTNYSGVGPDNVYRDPWGSPYVISMDLNYDENCADALYESRSGGVMVWSYGPDQKASSSITNSLPPNRDNVLSWQ